MKLNRQQLQNLLAFLNRVNLSGAEAEALVELKMVIAKELQEMPDEEKNNSLNKASKNK